MSPAWRRYLDRLRPHRARLALAAALLTVTALIPGLSVLALRAGLEAALAGAPLRAAAAPAAALVGLALADAGLKRSRATLTRAVSLAVASDLRIALHRRLLAEGAGDTSVGHRLAMLTQAVDEVQYGVSAAVTAYRNPITISVLGITALTLAPRLAGWALLALPLLALTSAWSGGRSRRLAREAQAARAALVHLAHDQLAHAELLRAFDAGEAEATRFTAADTHDRATRLALEVERVHPAAAAQVVASLALAGLLLLGASEVAAARLDAARLIGFVFAIALMERPFSGLAEVWSLAQRSLGALERVEAALAAPAAVPEPEAPAPLPAGPLALAWSGVSLRLGDNAVLAGVDLDVAPGEWVALVGPSGAGKSSLLRLATRRWDPTGGEVRLGGLALTAVAAAERRAAVALVPQDVRLLARSIRENLCLGVARSDDALWAALTTAGAAELVRALPKGLDTVIEEGGRLLSGGEAQRLCVARALLTDARVLLLDEPTNQLDPAATAAFIDAVTRARAGRTWVTVAHDPALAAAADRVVRLEAGRLQARPAAVA